MKPRLVLALVALIGGAGLAYAVTRDRDAAYDEERERAAFTESPPVGISLPDGFRAIPSKAHLGKLDPRLVEVVVDERFIRIRGRSVDAPKPSEWGSLRKELRACNVPLPFSHALDWAKRLSESVDAGGERANVVVDANTPFLTAFATLKWLACEGVTPTLVLETPKQDLGASDVLRSSERCERDVHVAMEGAAYEITRGRGEPLVRYGADCTLGAPGFAIARRDDEQALAACLGKAVGDVETRYFDTGSCIDLSAKSETPFADIVRVLEAGGKKTIVTLDAPLD